MRKRKKKRGKERQKLNSSAQDGWEEEEGKHRTTEESNAISESEEDEEVPHQKQIKKSHQDDDAKPQGKHSLLSTMHLEIPDGRCQPPTPTSSDLVSNISSELSEQRSAIEVHISSSSA